MFPYASPVQIDSSADGSNSHLVASRKKIELDEEASQWTDGEIRDAIDLIYEKLNKLDSDVSALVSASNLLWYKFPCC